VDTNPGHATHHAAEAANTLCPSREPGKDLTIRRKLMNPSTKDEIKGTFHEVKGEIKKKTGQVTNNPDLEADGRAEHNAGKVEKKIGQIEKVFQK
jgi:uncharacterized protein YjbJ (UPF0337 family)